MPDFNPDEYLSAKPSFNPDEYLSGSSNESPGITGLENPDVPTVENMALEQQRVDAIPERTFGEKAEGVWEAAKTLGTGATTGAIGFGAGTLTGIIGELTGRLKPGEGLEEAQALAAKFTNLPESEAGQEYVKGIGETLGTLPPVLGAPAVGGLNILSKMKSPLAKKIAESPNESVKKSFTKKLGEDRFQPHVFGMVKEARKQGFDDGMTTVIANASPVNKRAMKKQLRIMEAGKKDTLYQQKNRPADVAGDSLLRQVDFVRSNNKQAGQQLNRVAKSLEGKPVDVAEPVNKFITDLSEMGVKFADDGKVDFTDSTIEFSGPAKTLINNTLTKIKRNQTPDALDAHKFKKFLDEDLSHGKKLEGGVSGAVEKALGNLRRGVNKAIGDEHPSYKEANARFSDTIKSLDTLEDVVGRKLNQTGPNADKAFGTALRGLMNNTKGRANLMDAVDGIEATTKKYGGSFEDDMLTQMLFADELESVFGGTGRTSLKGIVKDANVDAALDATQMSVPGAVVAGAKYAARKARGINEKNQLKAIKKLLNTK